MVLAVRNCDDSIDAVVSDYYTAAYDAVGHLVERSCKNIAILNGPLSRPPYLSRHNGYLQALYDCHYPVDNRNILIVKENLFEEGYRATQQLLDSGRVIDGLVSAVDPLSIGAMRALRKNGIRVPEDIKLIDCTGNHITSMLETPLTVMEIQGEQMGMLATEKLINLIENNPPQQQPTVVSLPAKLIVREST